MTIDAGSEWAPPACTLPSVERPLRVSPTRLELVLTAGAEQAARELAARESACCSFFVLGFADAGETVLMSVQVRPSRCGCWTGCCRGWTRRPGGRGA